MDRYPIPAVTTRVETLVVNSRFIATIGEAPTVEAARAFIDAVRADFRDATHNVYAFRVGFGAAITEGQSDDGEPAGTAGRPALSVLRGADLGDVALVITRYFGGTKLGTGGLVRAYTESAQAALAALPRTIRVSWQAGRVRLPYSLYERIKALILAGEGEILSECFEAEVLIELRVPQDSATALAETIHSATQGRARLSLE